MAIGFLDQVCSAMQDAKLRLKKGKVFKQCPTPDTVSSTASHLLATAQGFLCPERPALLEEVYIDLPDLPASYQSTDNQVAVLVVSPESTFTFPSLVTGSCPSEMDGSGDPGAKKWYRNLDVTVQKMFNRAKDTIMCNFKKFVQN